jgi:hypothetical protein
MDVIEVDERDSSWEDPWPRFRVYLYEDHKGSYATRTYDITGADVLEVIQWAQDNVRGEDGLIAVALVGTHYGGEERQGLVWLLGSDDVYSSEPTETERAVLDKMRARGTRPLGHE